MLLYTGNRRKVFNNFDIKAVLAGADSEKFSSIHQSSQPTIAAYSIQQYAHTDTESARHYCGSLLAGPRWASRSAPVWRVQSVEWAGAGAGVQVPVSAAHKAIIYRENGGRSGTWHWPAHTISFSTLASRALDTFSLLHFILYYIYSLRTRGGGQIACFILIRDDGTMISSGAVVNCDTKGVMTVTRQVLRKIVAITAVVRVWNSPIKVYNGDNNLALTSQPMFHDKFAHKTVYNVFSSRADRHNLVQMRHCRNIMTVKL